MENVAVVQFYPEEDGCGPEKYDEDCLVRAIGRKLNIERDVFTMLKMVKAEKIHFIALNDRRVENDCVKAALMRTLKIVQQEYSNKRTSLMCIKDNVDTGHKLVSSFIGSSILGGTTHFSMHAWYPVSQ